MLLIFWRQTQRIALAVATIFFCLFQNFLIYLELLFEPGSNPWKVVVVVMMLITTLKSSQIYELASF